MGNVSKPTGAASVRTVQPGWNLDENGITDGMDPDDILKLKQRMPDPPTRRDFKTGAYRRQFGRARNGEL